MKSVRAYPHIEYPEAKEQVKNLFGIRRLHYILEDNFNFRPY